MTMLSPALDAAFSQDRVKLIGALKIVFPVGTVRLLDGAGEIDIGGELFTGEDPTFGVWESVDTIEDGTGDDAPGMTLALQPANAEVGALIASEDMQGSKVTAWVGAVDEATGTAIGTYAIFAGEIDVPTYKTDFGQCSVEYDAVGGMEWLFMDDEGIGLNASWHTQVWPGELGFSHATGITDNSYWGMNAPNGVSYS